MDPAPADPRRSGTGHVQDPIQGLGGRPVVVHGRGRYFTIAANVRSTKAQSRYNNRVRLSRFIGYNEII